MVEDALQRQRPSSEQAHSNQENKWYFRPKSDLLEHFHLDEQSGLTPEQIRQQQSRYGANSLPESHQRSMLSIFLEQLRGPMVFLLLVVAMVSAALHEYVDSIVVLAIVVLNSALGFFQDYRAERALAALRQLAAPTVKVRRDGVLKEILSIDLVPGDVLLLEAGNVVGADCRLIEVANLQTMEASLTGESEPVLKQSELIPEDNLRVADQRNMVFLGTTVTSGRGKGVVTATGLSTELGSIARSLQSVESDRTPLQKRLAQLGVTLALVAVAIVALVFVLGITMGESARLMLLTSLSLAVAIVPEGLPAVATVALALGARRMAARNALIRRLPAVETLGSVTVICSDKTGTLTQNKMSVTLLDVAGMTHHIDGNSDSTATEVNNVQQHSGLSLLLMAGTLCNDCSIVGTPDDHQIDCVGDPTELAIALAGKRFGFPKEELEKACPRVREFPFDSERKRMSTVHRIDVAGLGDAEWLSGIKRLLPAGKNDLLVCTKGALDSLLESCSYVWSNDQPEPLIDELRNQIRTAQNKWAGKGMRVLGIAIGIVDEISDDASVDSVEHDLIFVGTVAMIDPPREEAQEAVNRCRAAGIRPIMITGDHKLTALSVARELGMTADGRVVEGGDVSSEFQSGRFGASVYARVSPMEKLEIVRQLQRQGEVVAMTGDGVNDAPALKQSDIGVAMGIMGTDVARDAADMVLLDDNFATIVNAVEEGRVVFDNVRKFVKYTMTSNAGEMLVMVVGPLIGMPIPLVPLQILWINLVTDGLPGMALALEQPEPDVMTRPPLPPDQRIFDRRMVVDILWIGILLAAVSLGLGALTWTSDGVSVEYWRTMIFTTLTLGQLGNALATRSMSTTFLTTSFFTNRLLVFAIVVTVFLQVGVIYFPFLQAIFHTTSISLEDFGLCLLFGSSVFFVVELQKFLFGKPVTSNGDRA